MIKKNYIVEKSNSLNELKSVNMTLQETRILSIYLAKINARDIETRLVEFKLEDFQKIMDIDKMNVEHIKQVTNSLLCKIVNINLDGGGYTAFQLFKRCKLYQNDYGEWIIAIDAHDEALPLMFNMQGNYFKYQLWNCLSLKSSNQIRMYELLKQYEGLGYRIIPIDILKEMLGIKITEYSRWENFKVRVLDACQIVLKQKTDIYFNYEPIKKGRKFVAVKFIIGKNKTYKDPFRLHDFLNMDDLKNLYNSKDDFEENKEMNLNERFNGHNGLLLISEAVNNEFSDEEIILIFNKLSTKQLEPHQYGLEIAQYHYISEKYAYMNTSKIYIKHRFKYLCKLLDLDD